MVVMAEDGRYPNCFVSHFVFLSFILVIIFTFLLHYQQESVASLPSSYDYHVSFFLFHPTKVGRIPSQFGSLNATLQELCLANNFLTGAIPSSLGELKKMSLLDLSG